MDSRESKLEILRHFQGNDLLLIGGNLNRGCLLKSPNLTQGGEFFFKVILLKRWRVFDSYQNILSFAPLRVRKHIFQVA